MISHNKIIVQFLTHNEALRGLDALVQLMALDKDLASPPGSPADGDRYIVAASPSGAWSGQADKIAAWQDGAWAFYTPREGWRAWVADEDKLYFWDGSAWIAPSMGGGGGGAAASAVGLHNGKITESHASNAATFALKTLAGSDPSGGDPVTAIFPDGSTLSITAALSVTIPSTATMGFSSGAVGRIWVALANDGGTPRLGVRNCKASASIVGFPANGLLTSTAIGTGADNEHVTQMGSAVTDKPYILCAYAQWDSGLTTAGTWDASPTRIVQWGPHIPRPGAPVGNLKTAVNSGEVSASNSTPVQTNSTVSITPTDKANGIQVRVFGTIRTTNPNVIGAAQISRGTGPTLIGNVANQFGSASSALDAVYGPGAMAAMDYPNTTSAQAYYVYLWQQAGSVANAATWLPNAANSNSHMEAEEVMA